MLRVGWFQHVFLVPILNMKLKYIYIENISVCSDNLWRGFLLQFLTCVSYYLLN